MDRRGVEIRLDGEALTFYEKDERIATVPIAPLERIYVCGDTLVRAGLLAKLGERGVGVVFLSGRRFVPSLFLPKPHNDALRRIKQYELSSSNVFKMRFSREIVSRKIRAQSGCLLSLKAEHSECENELSELSDRLFELFLKLRDCLVLRNCEDWKVLRQRSIFQVLLVFFRRSCVFPVEIVGRRGIPLM